MSWVLKLMTAMLAVITVAVIVNGVVTSAWFSGLLYAVFVGGSLGQWATIRRESDEARSAADRMLIGVYTLLVWIALPALHSLEKLVFG